MTRRDYVNQFNQIQSRINTRSIKWDLMEVVFKQEDLLPMWIADMDFQAPVEINEAIIDRAEHGIYGYTAIDPTLKAQITSWLKRRHDWIVKEESLSFSPSVVTSLHLAVTTFTAPGDKILIQTPVYTPFFNVIKGHDREVITNELVLNKKTNKYEIDFTSFEQKLASGAKAFILCSPHNPVGRVWTKEELSTMANFCEQYGVLIISDEIHADLIYKPYTHIPIASLSEKVAHNTITFMSPSKSFNLAGLHASYGIITNKHLRKKFDDGLKKFGLNGLNTIGIYALEAAYKYGEQWLEQLLKVLEENKNYVLEQFSTHTPQLKVIDAEGTYLLWIDCSNLGKTDLELEKFFIEKAKVALNRGINYGKEGRQFMRMNIACPKPLLKKGITQIINAVKNHIQDH